MKSCVFLAGLLLGCVPLRANLISNGGFESSPFVAANSYAAVTPHDWTGGAFVFNGNVAGWPSPQQGNQFANIGHSGLWELFQTVVLTTDGTYDLTWYDNAAISYPYFVAVKVDDSFVGEFTGAGSSTWNARSLSLNLLAGSHVFRFVTRGEHGDSTGADTLIDDVQLTSSSKVPDTGSVSVFLGLSLAALVLARRFGTSPA